MRVAIYLAIASILHLDCAGEVIQRSSFKTIASEQLSAENIGIEVNGAKDGLHIFREASKRLSSPTDIVKGHRLPPTDTHELVLIAKDRNMAELTRILQDVSDPTSSNYGNHLTRQEVIDLTSNPRSCEKIVAYLHDAGATVLQVEVSVGRITARGKIGVWERMLNTEFYSYSFPRDSEGDHLEVEIHDDRKFKRTAEYFVPECLDSHVAFIQNTIDAPAANTRRAPQSPLSASDISISSRL